MGLGSQTMQFEFSSDGILYTIVIGDKKRTRQFAAVLMSMSDLMIHHLFICRGVGWVRRRHGLESYGLIYVFGGCSLHK